LVHLIILTGEYKLPNDTDTTPDFILVQETTKQQLFVLDTSGSMSVSKRIVVISVVLNFQTR